MRFEPRISLVTLGVADVARSRRFYEALGFTASSASQDGVAFMAAGGTVLSLYGRSALAADTGLADDGRAGFRAVTLAYNCRRDRKSVV